MDTLKEKTNEELFELYRSEKALNVKQELTLRYIYIVKAIAIQMHNIYAGSMQMEDIINEGAIAIMKGIDRYDPETDNKFETFISRRIRGLIIDLVRKNDWMPRDYHKQNRAIEETRINLTQTLGRLPSDEEIAGQLQISVKKCKDIQRMSTMVNVLSLDMVMDDDGERQSRQLPSGDIGSQPERAYMKGETVKILTEGINSLKEKEKLVVSLYYVEELSMSQIAQVLKVSEPRISQLHGAAIRKLKAYMNTHL